jgi:hypothetical protein
VRCNTSASSESYGCHRSCEAIRAKMISTFPLHWCGARRLSVLQATQDMSGASLVKTHAGSADRRTIATAAGGQEVVVAACRCRPVRLSDAFARARLRWLCTFCPPRQHMATCCGRKATGPAPGGMASTYASCVLIRKQNSWGAVLASCKQVTTDRS